MTMGSPSTPGDWFGAGPRIGAPALLLGLLLAFPCWIWHDRLRIPLPWPALSTAGAVLLAAGIAVYGWSVARLRRSRRQGDLATGGPFAFSRHPIYASWILLLLPGMGLLSGVWPLLLPSMLAYLSFRRHVGAEEALLRKRFGERYGDYAAQTPRLFAMTRKTTNRQPRSSE